jgi:hypothetical protein
MLHAAHWTCCVVDNAALVLSEDCRTKGRIYKHIPTMWLTLNHLLLVDAFPTSGTSTPR